MLTQQLKLKMKEIPMSFTQEQIVHLDVKKDRKIITLYTQIEL